MRLIRQPHGGVSSARNTGIGFAASPFIAFLDADDEWQPGHLETLLRLHKTFPDAGICATSYWFILPYGNRRMPAFSGFPGSPWEGVLPDYFRAAALGKPPVFSSAAGASKEVLLEAGLFAEGVHLGEDLDLWGRIALEYPVAFSHSGLPVTEKTPETACACAFPGSGNCPLLQLPVPGFPKEQCRIIWFLRSGPTAASWFTFPAGICCVLDELRTRPCCFTTRVLNTKKTAISGE